MRRRIKLTESDLRNLISESVRRITNEAEYRGVNLGGLDPDTWGGNRIDDLMDKQGWDTARVQKVVNNANRRLGNRSNGQPIANYRNAKYESILRTVVRESIKGILNKNESKLRRVVRESLLKEAYSDKLSYMTDALDYYANMVNSGKQLSQDQLSHVQEIYDFLNDTNSHDNYEVMTYWMPLAQNLLNGNTPESGLDNIVRESINRILKENADYEGMDLTDQDSLIMQAEDAIYRLNDRGEDYGWRQVAEEMGFRLETLNDDDIENLRDAIELAMVSGSV
jgi:hypothetical protein